MNFLDKIRSIFSRKKPLEDNEPSNNVVKNIQSPPISVANKSEKKENREIRHIHSVTEASLCRTSYGICKLREDGSKRYLIFPQQMDVKYIPFVENEIIEAVYTIDTSNFIRDDSGRFVYEIIDSAQFFMLSKEQKEEISADLKKRGIQYRFPQEIDNYNAVMDILRSSQILMRNQDSDWFEMERFLSNIMEIKGSNTYKELQLIRLKDGKRYILIINQIIANVVEYGPAFMNIYEPGAVKISYRDGYAFIAPLGKPG
ncbi:MAG: hypothetical protein ACP5QK_08565 [Myxococcota bacterium]